MERTITIISALLLSGCLALFLMSCGEDSSTSPESTGYTVTGRVVDSAGEVVGGVTITLSGSNNTYSTTSAENGIYTFKNVEEGLYLVSCRKDGYSFSIPVGEITVDSVITIPTIVVKTVSLVPTPSDGAIDVSVDTSLSWQVNNPPAGDITYDVKLGISEASLTIVVSGITQLYYKPDKLDPLTTYYWQVIMYFNNEILESSIWRFTVEYDVRQAVFDQYGEPDYVYESQFDGTMYETWIYAREDINRAYEFCKSESGVWNVNRMYYADYLGYELYLPPTIIHTPVTDAPAGQKITISAEVTDYEEVVIVSLYYRIPGDEDFVSSRMPSEGDTFSGEIPQEMVTTTGVEYYIEAIDDGDYKTTNPNKGYYTVNVTEAAKVVVYGKTVVAPAPVFVHERFDEIDSLTPSSPFAP